MEKRTWGIVSLQGVLKRKWIRIPAWERDFIARLPEEQPERTREDERGGKSLEGVMEVSLSPFHRHSIHLSSPVNVENTSSLFASRGRFTLGVKEQRPLTSSHQYWRYYALLGNIGLRRRCLKNPAQWTMITTDGWSCHLCWGTSVLWPLQYSVLSHSSKISDLVHTSLYFLVFILRYHNATHKNCAFKFTIACIIPASQFWIFFLL